MEEEEFDYRLADDQMPGIIVHAEMIITPEELFPGTRFARPAGHVHDGVCSRFPEMCGRR